LVPLTSPLGSRYVADVGLLIVTLDARPPQGAIAREGIRFLKNIAASSSAESSGALIDPSRFG
jgi:hypothetical protein